MNESGIVFQGNLYKLKWFGFVEPTLIKRDSKKMSSLLGRVQILYQE